MHNNCHVSIKLRVNMREFFKCTFGGLETSYLVRQYIFSVLIATLFIFMMTNQGRALSGSTIAMFSICTVLYPYSRFVYESIIDFVIGNNVLYFNAILMMAFKAFTMLFCWVAAVFIAPFGLMYIYFRQSKSES